MSSSGGSITFNGSSTYSSSFQQVINRAVGIASLPMHALQTSVSILSSQQSAFSSLFANFSSLQNAVQGLGAAAGGNVSAQVSNTSALTASTTSAALPGTYTIQVDDPGSSTTTLSKAGLTTVTDPSSQDISSASAFTLTINGVNHSITNSGSSLETLVNSINLAGDGVQATIINIGSSSAADYRLALTSKNLGADSIQLNDGSQDLIDTLATGTPALYKINGSSTDVSSTSRQITLSPGLTVNLRAQSSSPVTISVAQNFSGVQSAVSNLVSAYNTAFDALSQHRGQSGGALTGDSLVFTLTNVLRQISQYSSGSGPISTLTDLGVTLDSTGHLSLNTSALANPDTAALSQFLGTVSSSGFLKTANDDLNFVTDFTTGLIPNDLNALQSQISSDNSQIADQQSRIDVLQANLEAQLSRADAAIATLQSQKTYFQELFTATYGNGTGTTG